AGVARRPRPLPAGGSPSASRRGAGPVCGGAEHHGEGARMNETRPTDVFTLGETMIRLVPKGFTRLEEAQELECRIGGSESNLAAALTRLGLRATWISK